MGSLYMIDSEELESYVSLYKKGSACFPDKIGRWLTELKELREKSEYPFDIALIEMNAKLQVLDVLESSLERIRPELSPVGKLYTAKVIDIVRKLKEVVEDESD